MALRRALVEADGNPLRAAYLLGLSKSGMYRHMMAHGLRSQGHAEDPVLAAGEPVSLAGYERAALELVLKETGGNKRAATQMLGVGKSTLYRKLAQHGLLGA